MSFLHPVWLAALALIPALIVAALLAGRTRNRAWRALVAPRLRRSLLKIAAPLPRWIALAALFGALVCLIVSLARPQGDGGTRTESIKARNILVAIDLSRSMLVEDVSPNRLEQARASALELLDALPDDRIGVIAFAGTPYLVAPLTIDHAAVRETVQQLDTETIPTGGSNLAAATHLAIKTFRDNHISNGALVILSDGEEHDGDIASTARDAEEAGMFVFAVAIGTDDGGLIPDPRAPDRLFRDKHGNPVHSRRHDEALRRLATETGGRFIHAASGAAIGPMVDAAIGDLERLEIDTRQRRVAVEFYQWLLLPAVVLLIVAIVANTRWRPGITIRRAMAGAAGVLLVGGVAGLREVEYRYQPNQMRGGDASIGADLFVPCGLVPQERKVGGLHGNRHPSSISGGSGPPEMERGGRTGGLARRPLPPARQAGRGAAGECGKHKLAIMGDAVATMRVGELLGGTVPPVLMFCSTEAPPKSGGSEAARFAELAAKAMTNDARCRYRLAEGDAALAAGDLRTAEAAFSAALLSPDPEVQAAAHHNLGNTLIEQGWRKLSGGKPYPGNEKASDELGTYVAQQVAKWMTENPDEAETAEGMRRFESVLLAWTDAARHFDSATRADPGREDSAHNREVAGRLLDELRQAMQDTLNALKQMTPKPGQGDSRQQGQPQPNQGNKEGQRKQQSDQQGDKNQDKQNSGDKPDDKDKQGGDQEGDQKNQPNQGDEKKDSTKKGKNQQQDKGDETPEERARRLLRENADFESGPLIKGRRYRFRRPDFDW